MDLESSVLISICLGCLAILIAGFLYRGRLSAAVIGTSIFSIFFTASQIGVRVLFADRAGSDVSYGSSLQMGTSLLVAAVAGLVLTEFVTPSASPRQLLSLSQQPAATLRGTVAIPLTFILLAYVAANLAYDSQHPIWLILKGQFGTLSRDILFEYASETEGPIYFQPSFLRSIISGIVLPLGLLCNEQIRRGRHSALIRLCGRLLVITAVVMTLTRFKRFPIIELVIPFLSFYAGYGVLKRKTLLMAAALVIAIPILLSTFIYGNSDVINSLLIRSAYVESLMDNFALSSGFARFLPNATSYLGLYLDRLFGDGESPSMALKTFMLAGEGRGYDSLSLFSEIFVSFGVFGPFAIGLLNACWHRFDRLLYRLSLQRGVMSIWCVYTATFGIGFQKGFLPKLLSGGGLYVALMGVAAFSGVLCYRTRERQQLSAAVRPAAPAEASE